MVLVHEQLDPNDAASRTHILWFQHPLFDARQQARVTDDPSDEVTALFDHSRSHTSAPDALALSGYLTAEKHFG